MTVCVSVATFKGLGIRVWLAGCQRSRFRPLLTCRSVSGSTPLPVRQACVLFRSIAKQPCGGVKFCHYFDPMRPRSQTT
ncbi:hypothetical protein D3C78_1161660 [compost metagenome]